jgi:hypothetical protein
VLDPNKLCFTCRQYLNWYRPRLDQSLSQNLNQSAPAEPVVLARTMTPACQMARLPNRGDSGVTRVPPLLAAAFDSGLLRHWDVSNSKAKRAWSTLLDIVAISHATHVPTYAAKQFNHRERTKPKDRQNLPAGERSKLPSGMLRYVCRLRTLIAPQILTIDDDLFGNNASFGWRDFFEAAKLGF